MSQTEDFDLLSIATETAVGVFHCDEWGRAIGAEVIEALKVSAKRSTKKWSRLCMHPSTSLPWQEMLIVMHHSSQENPQRRVSGPDTKLVLEGQASLQYFDGEGKPTRQVKLGAGANFYVNTNTDEFHALRIDSEWFVFMEFVNGPFDSGTTEFANWGSRGSAD